jgi:transposase-like protein
MARSSSGAIFRLFVPNGGKPRRFSDEFKRDAVRLITEERYTFKAAASRVRSPRCSTG